MPELLTALEFAWLPVQWSGRKITYTYREKKKSKGLLRNDISYPLASYP